MSLRLFPAIDIQGGHCVRLRQGDFAQETVFGNDPVAMAQHWVNEGAQYLHVVDLDGARAGKAENFTVIAAIAKSVNIPVQMGGGLRTDEAVERLADTSIARAVIGTQAVEDFAFLARALDKLGPERLVVAVDAEEGMVKTRGWVKQSDVWATDLVKRLAELGVREILYTDISRDGMMQGVALSGIQKLAESMEAGPDTVQIIASGGVASLDDLRALRDLEPLGVTGVIAGRSLYENRFTVAEALAALSSEDE